MLISSRLYREHQRDNYKLHPRKCKIVERFINRIKWYRRILYFFQKLARPIFSFLQFCRHTDLA